MVKLLVWIGVFGCGRTISMRVWSIGTISLSKMNSLASSTLEDEDITYLIICVMVRIGTL